MRQFKRNALSNTKRRGWDFVWLLPLGVFDEKVKIDVMILITTFEIKISFSFPSQAHSSIPKIIACSLATRTDLYLPEPMGTVAW